MPRHIENYPRPQLVREAWEDLNGVWDFAFDDANEGAAAHWQDSFPTGTRIVVPFAYECGASGIGDERMHPVVWYRRFFTPDPAQAGKRILLHFEGCDYRTAVWVNGQLAGAHTGGYTRFSFDVTDLLRTKANTIVVRAEDSFEKGQPRGKQRWEPENFGCWYVQTTGIWKPVWAEYVPETRVESLKLTPSMADVRVEWTLAGWSCADALAVRNVGHDALIVPPPEAPDYFAALSIRAAAFLDGKRVAAAEIPVTEARGALVLTPETITLWSPESPALYELTVELTADNEVIDSVQSYFGLREISTKDGQILLNGKPYYQRLLLDQGYWRQSHLTPPDEAALLADVVKTKEMGFNGARKHQKVEDERFYYFCDIHGLLVWSEMPAAYAYSDGMAQAFLTEWLDVVRLHYNHPCVVTWTPINESWGVENILTDRAQQQFTEAVYHATKALDQTRPVIVNDGWEHTVSDIFTLHDYEESGAALYERYTARKDEIFSGTLAFNMEKTSLAQGYAYRGQPVIISEYGGAAYTADKQGAAWGYGNGVADENALVSRIADVTDAIRRLPYVCGYCYTQTTDVQQEVNGLMDENRRFKADPARLRAIFGK